MPCPVRPDRALPLLACRALSCFTVSRHALPDPVVPRQVEPDLTLPALPFQITSLLARPSRATSRLPCRASSCPVSPRHVKPYLTTPAVPCLASLEPWRAGPNRALPDQNTPRRACHALPRRVRRAVPYPIIPRPALPAIPCPAVPCPANPDPACHAPRSRELPCYLNLILPLLRYFTVNMLLCRQIETIIGF